MRTLTLVIELLSDALIGSGEGWGATIDADIVFDELGLPYIPGKRIKGCLRDSATEVLDMFEKAQIKNCFDLSRENTKREFKLINSIFGRSGQETPSSIYCDNLYIPDYENVRAWFEYLSSEYPSIITRDAVLSTFTYIRQQTRINKDGIAEDYSLRTIRVIKKGNSFQGSITIEDDSAVDLLNLACRNLRRIGTKRTRGFGEVKCRLYENKENKKEIDLSPELEALCRA